MTDVVADETATPDLRAASMRPWRVGVLAALLVLALVAAGAIAWTRRSPEIRPVTTRSIRTVTGATIPAPAPDTADAVGGFRDTETLPWSAARTGEDDRQLVVWFASGWSPCEIPDGFTSEVSERAAGVVIRVHAVRQQEREHEQACITSLADAERGLVVELPSPLGARAVFDGVTDERKPVFDSHELIQPTWLPPGWAVQDEVINGPGPRDAPSSRTWSQTFTNRSGADAPSFTITQRRPKQPYDASANFPPEWAATHVDIDGTDVTVFRVQDQRTLRIEDGDQSRTLYLRDLSATGLTEQDLAHVLASTRSG